MTQPKFKVKRGDYVEVISGGQKGRRGYVSKVFLEEARVLVSGIGEYTRHIRPSQQHPEGKVVKQRPIHISNVLLVDPTEDLPGRVGYKIDENGSKVRYFKASGHVIEKVIQS